MILKSHRWARYFAKSEDFSAGLDFARCYDAQVFRLRSLPEAKADPVTRRIMILMVTALNELGDIERAVQSGTDDFLSKRLIGGTSEASGKHAQVEGCDRRT